MFSGELAGGKKDTAQEGRKETRDTKATRKKTEHVSGSTGGLGKISETCKVVLEG